MIPQSVDEQTAIATILTEMDDEIENLEMKLTKYRQVKQGMMQQLLTGKIRLKNDVEDLVQAEQANAVKILPARTAHNRQFDDAVSIAAIVVLMMDRGLAWNVESVRALNIIDIVFSDDDTVRARWKEYYKQLCIQEPNDMQLKQKLEAQDKLLEAMAKSLGYEDQVTWETIQNPYTPRGMWEAMQQQQNIYNGQEKLAGAVDLFTKFFGATNPQTISSATEQREVTHVGP